MPARTPLRIRHALIAALAAAVVSHAQPVLANPETDKPAEQASPVFSLQSIMMQGVVNRALQNIGVPYRFGGSNPTSGFDCSGLVNHVYREALGIVLPRTSRQLASVGTPLAISCFSTRVAPRIPMSASIWAMGVSSTRLAHVPSFASIVSMIRATSKYSRVRVGSTQFLS